MRASPREGRNAEQRGLRGERGAHARVSEERYGRSWRGERGLYARASAEGGYRSWRGERLAYRDRTVGESAGTAAADYGYRTRRLSHMRRPARSAMRRAPTTTMHAAMMSP
jgi:hypothetical protein